MELEPRTSAPAHATGAVEFVDLSAIEEDATFRLREEGDVSALASSMGRLGQLVPLELRLLSAAPDAPLRYQLLAGFRRVAALKLLRRERALARVHPGFSDEDAWALALAQGLLTEPLDRAAVAALGLRLAHDGTAPWAAELIDEALVRAPIEPELRERFFDFLGTPEAAGAPSGPSDDAGLDGEPMTGDEGYLAALDGAPAGDEPVPAAEAAPADEADSEADSDSDSDSENEAEAEGEAEAEAEAGEGEEAVEVTPEELSSDLAIRLYDLNADLLLAWESWADLPPEGRRAIVEQARWIAGLLPRLEEGAEDER
jgi:hypothetical protein